MKDGENSFVVTVSELVTLTNPYYLIRIVHDQTHNEYSCIAPDTSDYPDRYNLFVVTQMANPDNTDAEIEVEETGLFHYYIYEQTSATNLDYTNATALLESGKLTFPATTTSDNTYTGYPATSNVYKG